MGHKTCLPLVSCVLKLRIAVVAWLLVALSSCGGNAPGYTSRGTGSGRADASSAPSAIPQTGPETVPTAHAATLTWQPPATTPQPLAGYKVYRQSSPSETFRWLVTVTDPTFTDSTVLAGESYSYVVTAVDIFGNESTFSGPVSATIPVP
jgi:hypothetical protein